MNGLRDPTLSIVVTTYEWPEALDVVLRSLSEQKDDEFEVIVADDGSASETRALVEAWTTTFPVELGYVRQDDRGSRQARSRNLGALQAKGAFLVFLDGDSMVRSGFVRAVRRAMLPGWFLTSKRLNLSAELSEQVLAHHLPIWRWSALRWLAAHPRELVSDARPREPNRPGMILPLRDRRRPWRDGQPEYAPPYNLYGCFIGMWRKDLERVNGFDMRFEGWGEEDVDVNVRLRRAGLRCGWPGPRATVLHLWHPDRNETSSGNWPLVRETESSGLVEAVDGLRELARELARDHQPA
jgi:glycosyltransferase involved in cell wall biosynthesis